MNKMRYFHHLLFLCSVFIFSCQENSRYESRLVSLAQEYTVLQCQLKELHETAGKTWEEMTAILAVNLPADVPERERQYMLLSSNADHIRMFESYQSFDDSVKYALATTEKRDAELAAKVMRIKQRLTQIDEAKMKIYASDATNDNKRLKNYQQIFEQNLSTDCDL